MSLMAIIAAGQKGLLIRAVGGAVGVDEPVARAALERLLQAMARRLTKRADNREERRILLETVAAGGFQRYLDDPRALLGRDTIRDGEDLLTYLYGSVDVARDHARTIGPPSGLDAEVFTRLMTVAACLLLGAMARRLEQQTQDRLVDVGATGLVMGLVQAIWAGIMEGTARSMFRRRASFRYRMGAERRRQQRGEAPSGRPELEEILGDLLGAGEPN
jgi:hypothetical protein